MECRGMKCISALLCTKKPLSGGDTCRRGSGERAGGCAEAFLSRCSRRWAASCRMMSVTNSRRKGRCHDNLLPSPASPISPAEARDLSLADCKLRR